MSGYAYGTSEPIEACPYCGEACEADFVDVGVGYTQCGPFHCVDCGASEIGPYDAERPLSDKETACGWYAPGAPPSEHANMLNGRIVSHRKMEAVYREEFTGNPLWEDKDYVDRWYAERRAGGPEAKTPADPEVRPDEDPDD